MRLLRQISAFLLPLLTSTTALASTTPASTQASPTYILEYSNDVQLVAYWSPISTITHPASPTSSAYSEAASDHDLLRREVVTGPAAAAPTDPGQVSPITTIQVNQMVNGVAQQLEVVYTQLFSAVPDQGDAPASGSIGLGTIQGQVGGIKTANKREAAPQPTEVADAKVERRILLEEDVVESDVMIKRDEDMQRVERRSLAGKLDANNAGSALALLVAIAVMIVV